MARAALSAMEKTIPFGQYALHGSEIFFQSPLSLGFVNLKPIVPGHVLVIPRRVVKRFTELLPEEVADMFVSAQKVAKAIEMEYKADALTIAVQDGKLAGQTVEHVHVHVIPRHGGDFPNNDDIYKELEKHDKAGGRQPRTAEAMSEEAFRLSTYFRA
eukprot:Opistho-2@87338